MADSSLCESWNVAEWVRPGEPIDPSPNARQAVNGRLAGWSIHSSCPARVDGSSQSRPRGEVKHPTNPTFCLKHSQQDALLNAPKDRTTSRSTLLQLAWQTDAIPNRR